MAARSRTGSDAPAAPPARSVVVLPAHQIDCAFGAVLLEVLAARFHGKRVPERQVCADPFAVTVNSPDSTRRRTAKGCEWTEFTTLGATVFLSISPKPSALSAASNADVSMGILAESIEIVGSRIGFPHAAGNRLAAIGKKRSECDARSRKGVGEAGAETAFGERISSGRSRRSAATTAIRKRGHAPGRRRSRTRSADCCRMKCKLERLARPARM